MTSSRGSSGTIGPFQTGVMGDFVLEQELGRGGMGVVYAAAQKSMGRRVALKVLPTFAGLDPEAVTRFRREAEAAGRLSHPGIVPVFGVGEQDGVHYFAMELVQGPPLSRLLDVLSIRRPEKMRAAFVEEAEVADEFPTLRVVPGESSAGNRYHRSCAAMMADVANALAAAHRQHVIHRDVKPSNILLHPDGRPVLVDFGLARDELADSLTLSGDQIGTPSYMSPEQARGRRDLDARVDVYGLGAVLYELLTLRPPFESASAAETMHKILEEEPVPVRKRNPQVPVDLATIVQTCLAKDPDDRYPVMEALELDLRNFLAGRRIMARAPSFWTRLRGAVRRHRKSATVAAGTLLVAGLVAFSAGVVGESRAVYLGRDALEEARSMLVDLARPDRARDLYAHALALLKDPDVVQRARVEDFRAAFDAHYPDRLEALRAFVPALSPAEREQVDDLLRRIDGRGSIGFVSRRMEQRVQGLRVKALRDGELERDWRAVTVGEPLPLGEYLVRIETIGNAPVVEWVRVLRDEVARLRPNVLPPGALPEETVQVTDPRSFRSSAVAVHETTRAEYREWLQELDESIRAEMIPLGWDGGIDRPRHPVRGLSYYQARTFLAHHDAHLPTAREFWLAASAGLQRLRHPWGSAFDPQFLVADPLQLEDAEPVDSRPRGASPLGVMHLLGNAAEIASLEQREAPVMLGGHFHWDNPRELTLDGESVPITRLGSIMERNPYAGVRRFHFLPVPEDPLLREKAHEKRAEVRLVALGSTFHDWQVGRDGRLRYGLELNGIHDGTNPKVIPLSTFGFLQDTASLQARDGFGRPVGLSVARGPDGESSRATVRLPDGFHPGQGYRVLITCELLPTSGLVPEGDSYVLSIPIKGGLHLGALHTVRLPSGTRVEEVRPAPHFRYAEAGGEVLVWETSRQNRVESAVVLFRIDGMLGERPSFRGEVTTAVAGLLTAWNGRDPGLRPLLDPEFLHVPGGRDFEDLGDRYRNHHLVDSVAVGDVVSADVSADWEMRGRDGATVTLRNWPLLVQFRRSDDRMRCVRLMPRSRSDHGRRTVAGGYRHDRLRATVAALEGSVITRTQDGWTEMQVKLLPDDRDDLFVQIVGHFAPEGETEQRVRFRLTGGAIVLRPGERLRAAEVLDSSGKDTMQWAFVGPDGIWDREEWTFLTRGRRHFLVRRVARATTFDGAEDRFRSTTATEWFERAAAALVIE